HHENEQYDCRLSHFSPRRKRRPGVKYQPSVSLEHSETAARRTDPAGRYCPGTNQKRQTVGRGDERVSGRYRRDGPGIQKSDQGARASAEKPNAGIITTTLPSTIVHHWDELK